MLIYVMSMRHGKELSELVFENHIYYKISWLIQNIEIYTLVQVRAISERLLYKIEYSQHKEIVWVSQSQIKFKGSWRIRPT